MGARLPKFSAPRFDEIPALGRCIEPASRDANAELERPPAGTAPIRLCCMVWRRLAVCCEKDAGRAMLLCAPKNRCGPPLRTVDGAAARPLADKLAREGTTGRLPAIMRAPLSCVRLAGIAAARPAPKCPALTVDIAPPIWVLCRLAMFEYRRPLCSGEIPPKRLMFVTWTFVIFTTPKRPRYPPHHGWK